MWFVRSFCRYACFALACQPYIQTAPNIQSRIAAYLLLCLFAKFGWKD